MPPRAEPRAVPVQPVSFGTCAGWLHGGRAATAVVVAGSLGLEMLTTQRFVRIAADVLAARGLAVLRFDWTGSGDSLGDAPDVASCRDDLDAAIATVRALTGAHRIVLVGLRFGALIAAARAATDDIDDLVLLAPPGSGRQFARELTGLSRLIDAALPPPPGEPVARGDGVVAAGFVYPASFLDELKGLTGPDLSGRGGSLRALILRPSGAAGPDLDFGLPPTAMTRLGFAGYERMMIDPTAGEVAVAAIETVADWLAPADAPDEPALPARAATRQALVAPGFREERVLFGSGGRLAGVWCQPALGPGRHAVIFTNAGGIPHVGWARMTVDHARRLAAAGVASFRMDFAEIGDSTEAADGPRQGLYEDGPRRDLAAALDWVSGHGYGAVTVVGVCSGAHHAFQLARSDRRVAGLVLVNILCFVWGQSYALQLSAWRHARVAGADLAAASRRSFMARLGAPLLDHLRPIAKLVLAQSVALPRRLAGLRQRATRLAGRAAYGPVERAVRDMAERGAWIAFVSAAGDDSLVEIARHLGPAAARVSNLAAVTFELIPAADHTLTPAHARAQLGDLLLARLGDAPADDS